MTSDWQDYLATHGARFDNGQIVDFGDPARELSAAREATVLCPLTHLAAFECTGNDAQTFLHNQLTSDVNHLGADAAQYAGWCSPKGRMLVSFILSRNTNGFLGLLSADLLAFTLKRLQMYVLRSKVSIVDRSAEFNCLGVSGPQAEAALQSAGLPVPTGPMSTASSATTKVIRLDELRFVIIADSATASTVWESLSKNAVPAGAPAWCWLDIQAGIPIIAEATKEAFVPQMVKWRQLSQRLLSRAGSSGPYPVPRQGQTASLSFSRRWQRCRRWGGLPRCRLDGATALRNHRQHRPLP